nr:multifunctional CCA tRNA nucleotidyl transferase/2'3'-cyclic phosphodiesterase/2'nucleotidase/phosphatase [uncultured Rhodoferax sp.]
MKTYLVGGAVRDALMGLSVQDRDWVVVGATPQMLLDLGYLQVGQDFPVFLHPQTKEEYALARTERNTAPGYRGFAVYAAPDVTLEEDLARRDLTINSIAIPSDFAGATGHFHLNDAVVDPYGGRNDIAHKVLRHVTPAFREDPVRILRLARFAARFTEFTVAPETLALMREMVQAGDADHLVAERVWQELSRGLLESKPSRMFAVLRACDALDHLLPELATSAEAVMPVLDLAAQRHAPLTVRFACLVHSLQKPQTEAACARLRVPVECKELAEVVAREQGSIQACTTLGAEALVLLLERCDAFRKPARLADILLACECIAKAPLGRYDSPYPQTNRLQLSLQLAQAVATNVIAANAQSAGASGPEIGEHIRRARIQAVATGL